MSAAPPPVPLLLSFATEATLAGRGRALAVSALVDLLLRARADERLAALATQSPGPHRPLRIVHGSIGFARELRSVSAPPYPVFALIPRDPAWDASAPIPHAPLPGATAPLRIDVAPDEFPEGSIVFSADALLAFAAAIHCAREYDPAAPADAHGRFDPAPLLAGDPAAFDHPAADLLARRVGEALFAAAAAAAAPADPAPAPPSPGPWGLAVTHDVDSLRLWKPRRVASWLLRGPHRPELAASAARGLLSPTHDPHAQFAPLRDWEAKNGIAPTIFVIPERRSPADLYDLPADLRRGDPVARRLAAELRAWKEAGAEIALHPPYASLDEPDRLPLQRDLLQRELKLAAPPTTARHHWLRLRQPAGLAALARAGFRVDSTIGHSAVSGFRAATCHPYTPADLHAAAPLPILEIPLIAMDVTLRHHQRLAAREALDRLRLLRQRVSEVGGILTLLWHTNSFDPLEWRGWQRVFREFITESLAAGARTATLATFADEYQSRAARLRAALEPVPEPRP